MYMMNRSRWPEEFQTPGREIEVWKVLAVHKQGWPERCIINTPAVGYPVTKPILEADRTPVIELNVTVSIPVEKYDPFRLSYVEAILIKSYGKINGNTEGDWCIRNCEDLGKFIDVVKELGGTWRYSKEFPNVKLFGGAIHCYRDYEIAKRRNWFGIYKIFVRAIGLSDNIIGIGEDREIAFSRIELKEVMKAPGSDPELRNLAKELLGL